MNHRLAPLSLAVLLLSLQPSPAQMSSGNYRVPYANGLNLVALEDHLTHALSNRVDLRGNDTSTNVYAVVAAEAGTVQAIRDFGGAGTNYVWIRHANGEWTGYFYLRQNSVTSVAGLSVGSVVAAGDVIGIEGTVGSPGGSRLRFEVGVPANPADPIAITTGLIKGSSRIPALCNVPQNVFQKTVPYQAADCEVQEFSYGIYRFPYTNGVFFKVNGDHLTHTPKTRLDLQGLSGAPAPFPIVAAAAGTVMAVVETNFIQCNTSSTCANSNNYVWIRHSNGEWTKYTHFVQNSVVVTNGQNVVAGQYLGAEGAVGFAGGVHLHFEVAVPTNLANPFNPSGGFINGINRIPLFCGVPDGLIWDGMSYYCSPCGGGGCQNDIVLPARIIRGTEAHLAAATIDSANNVISLDTYASLALYAGNKVTLRPGFHAFNKSYLRAAIQPCVNAP